MAGKADHLDHASLADLLDRRLVRRTALCRVCAGLNPRLRR
jgi:hypothetical protein